MPADSSSDKKPDTAETVLSSYIFELKSSYTNLLDILNRQKADIMESDEKMLDIHSGLEREAVTKISGLLKAVVSYREKIPLNPEDEAAMAVIIKLREECSALSGENISLLRGELSRLSGKLASFKLPKKARRVYYSGETTSIMDIEI